MLRTIVSGKLDLEYPLVSICIPTYNRAATIGRALESATSQDYANLEIIVADNASDDETATVVELFTDRDPRVKYVRHAANIGMVANLNTVIRLGSGKYRMWLADDDWIDDDLVGRCCELLESDPELAMVAGRCREYRNGRDEGARAPTNLRSRSPFLRILKYYATVADNSVFYGLYRSEFVCRYPMADNEIGADWQFLAAIASHGKIRTIEDSCIYRDASGVSSNLRGIAAGFGLTGIYLSEPYLAAAIAAYRDISRQSLALKQWPGSKRQALALSVFALLLIKKVLLRRVYLGMKRIVASAYAGRLKHDG